MLFNDSSLPEDLWEYAIAYSHWLRNRLPCHRENGNLLILNGNQVPTSILTSLCLKKRYSPLSTLLRRPLIRSFELALHTVSLWAGAVILDCETSWRQNHETSYRFFSVTFVFLAMYQYQDCQLFSTDAPDRAKWKKKNSQEAGLMMGSRNHSFHQTFLLVDKNGTATHHVHLTLVYQRLSHMQISFGLGALGLIENSRNWSNAGPGNASRGVLIFTSFPSPGYSNLTSWIPPVRNYLKRLVAFS